MKRKRQVNEAGQLESAPVDYFQAHLTREIPEDEGKKLLMAKPDEFSIEQLEIPGFSQAERLSRVDGDPTTVVNGSIRVPSKLRDGFEQANGGEFDQVQRSIYSVIERYSDLMAIGLEREQYELLYCLHVLNHAQRTRQVVLANKKRLESQRCSMGVAEMEVESCRDQGLARPKTLILCPFKKYARSVLDRLVQLMFAGGKPLLTNAARFYKEFSEEGYTVEHRKDVDDDYKELISGNVDDCFRVGIGVARKSLKLYTDFASSDIIIASPLGLRMIVGEEAEVHHEHDFLSSIEILVIDGADVMLMQNWDHLLHIMENLHLKPTKMTVDISRVRQWSLNGFSSLYRQTLLFARMPAVQFRSFFSRYCKNYAGQLTLTRGNDGVFEQIEVNLCQELHRFEVFNPADQSEDRFVYFKERILPQLTAGTLIFVSDYFDYVRIRNFFKRERESFVQLYEYAKNDKIARARDLFFHGKKRLMILTERFHFFRRYRIRGIRSIVFYQLPLTAQFYPQLINMANEDGNDRVKSRLIHCRFDLLRLINVFGKEKAMEIHRSQKNLHMLLGE